MSTAAPTSADSRNHVPLALCILLLLAFAAFIGWNLDEPFTQDFDEGVYLCSARSSMDGQPLFGAVFSSQPPMFLRILTLALHIGGDTVIVGRLLVLFFALASLAAVGWMAWQIMSPAAAPLAILLWGATPLFLRHARIVQAEMPAVAFSLLAIATLVSARHNPTAIRFVCAGVLFALGVYCKLLVVPMIVPLSALVVAAWPSTATKPAFFRRITSPLVLRNGVLFVGAGLLTGILGLYPWDMPSIYDQMVEYHLHAKQLYTLDRAENADILLQVVEPSMVLVLLSFAGLVCVVVKKPLAALWLGGWILVALAFLLDHTPLFPRHALILQPALAIAAAANALWAPSLLKRPWILVLVGSWLVALILLAALPAPERSHKFRKHWPEVPEIEAVRLIQEHSQPTDLVVSDQQMQVFRAGRHVPPQLCDTSFVRIKSGYLTDDDAIRASENAQMIIFWTGRLAALPRYATWVESHYRLLPFSEGSDERKIYVRESPD